MPGRPARDFMFELPDAGARSLLKWRRRQLKVGDAKGCGVCGWAKNEKKELSYHGKKHEVREGHVSRHSPNLTNE